MNKKSAFVLASEFKPTERLKEATNTNDRDDMQIFDLSFLKSYKISELMKICSYGVRPSKLKQGALSRRAVRRDGVTLRQEVQGRDGIHTEMS